MILHTALSGVKSGGVDYFGMRDWLRQRFGFSTFLSLLGALISGIGAVWVFAQENQFVGISAVVVFIGVLISILGAFASSGERTRFERELRKSSEENARLSREIMHSVTGGDSWCLLFFKGYANNSPGKGEILISHEGNYTLHDLTIEVVDGQKFDEEIKDIEAGRTTNRQATSWFHVGNLIPTEVPSISHLGWWDLPTTDERDFMVRCHARNGMWAQKHKARLVNGRWVEATRVVRTDDAGNLVVLHEEVSRDFPRDEQGQIDWAK